MNPDPSRNRIIKTLMLVVLVIAILLGAFELAFLVDVAGLDFAITFLLAYFVAIRDSLVYRYRIVKSEFMATVAALSSLYLFRPRVFVSHATASGLLFTLTCSVLFACLIWLPLFYLSAGFPG